MSQCVQDGQVCGETFTDNPGDDYMNSCCNGGSCNWFFDKSGDRGATYLCDREPQSAPTQPPDCKRGDGDGNYCKGVTIRNQQVLYEYPCCDGKTCTQTHNSKYSSYFSCR